MSDSSDDEPVLANFLAARNTRRNSNSSGSSLPEWIKVHQVRCSNIIAATCCSRKRRSAWHMHGETALIPLLAFCDRQTPQKEAAVPEPSTSSDARATSALATQQGMPELTWCTSSNTWQRDWHECNPGMHMTSFSTFIYRVASTFSAQTIYYS